MHNKALASAVGRYLANTTLHGFKYFTSQSNIDKILWLSSCLISACCSGVLCAVLWTRYSQVPTILHLKPINDPGAMPSIGFCYPPSVVAESVVSKIGYNDTLPLAKTLAQLLQGRPASKYELSILDSYLGMSRLNLSAALLSSTPSCEEITKMCQIDGKNNFCDVITHRDITEFGACCIMRSSEKKKNLISFEDIQNLLIVLNYPNATFPAYIFIVYRQSQGWMEVTRLSPGYWYNVPIYDQTTQSGDDDEGMESSCVAWEGYSRVKCQLKCKELLCGCSDPLSLRDDEDLEYSSLEPCSVARIPCLWNKINRDSCKCQSECRTNTNTVTLLHLQLTLQYSLHPIFDGLDTNLTTVLSLRVQRTGSNVFERVPTETWLTLLSSLGGVLNMFLGVGLFSALELVNFILQLPAIVRRGAQLPQPT